MMRRFSRSLRALLLLVGAGATMRADAANAAGESVWSGNVAGELGLLTWKGAPRLSWKLQLGAGGRVELMLEGTATDVRAEMATGEDGAVQWKVTRGRVALATWLQGMLTRGEGELRGNGTRRNGHFMGTLALTVRDVDLAELLRLADPKQERVRSAEGRVEGVVAWRLNNDGTVNLGDSELHLTPGTVATIAFKPAPGLLTNYIPAAVRDAYPGLVAIEMGQTPLEAQVLRLTYFAVADAEGKTARVRIEGKPKDPRLVAPLELDVNVSGPVESVLREMSDKRLHFGAVR